MFVLFVHMQIPSLLPINTTGRGHNCMNNVDLCGKVEPSKIFSENINQEESTLTLI